MRRTLVPALILALVSPAFAATAGTPVKPIVKSDVARAAATRVKAAQIPRLTKYAKPTLRSIDTLRPKTQAPNPPPAEPPPSTEPVLSAEQLALDVVEITADHLTTPQVGVWLQGMIETWGLDWYRAIWVRPGEGRIIFYPVVPWIQGRSLLVECRGYFNGPSKVTYGRFSYAKYVAEDLGSLVVDIAGDDQLSFVVPAAPLDGWERLIVDIVPGDGMTYDMKFQHCKFTRL